ncbi:MAG: hypothetical protein SFW09_15350 [Hyphomicrobiaceae bacterium]|nr:hypothetical protein [Hyphomicrobiaceae bacterium]
MTKLPDDIVVLDSVTHFEARHKGAVAFCGSHAGIYAAYYAASKGIAAIVLNDAGIGRERAGVAGLGLLERLGVPGAAISHMSARIGEGADGVERGLLTTVNKPAAALGLKAGQACREALLLLHRAAPKPSPKPDAIEESRFEVPEAGRDGVKVYVIDSMSLVKPEDDGHVIVAASHGGALGGRPEMAIKYPVFAAICNDADRGIDNAGITRLPALDQRGIAGACVSAFSARIGDGRSTYADGYISAINETARRYGGMIGQSTKDFVAAMVSARLATRS